MSTRTFARISLFTLAALLVLLSGVASGYAQTNTPMVRWAENPLLASEQRQSTGTLPTIVLVHGAWADSSGWNESVKELQKKGYTALAVANPLRGLHTDAAYLSSVLDNISDPIVLVGHSYGGMVLTNAATGHANVKALVYIAAFAPDQGEKQIDLIVKNPGSEIGPDTLTVRPYPGGLDSYITPSVFRRVFAHDVAESTAAVMAATQRPFELSILEELSGPPAWETIPSWYLIATEDRAIPPATQRFMAERAGATIAEVRASHVPMNSRPSAVTDLILQAATAVD
jgi:pimeloyl-ACP methyl ester carboxylesterase